MESNKLNFTDSKRFKKILKESGNSENTGLRKQYISKDIEQEGSEDSRFFRFTISTSKVDRDRDTVNPEGFDLTNFKNSPTVLFAHDNSKPPIGRASEIEVDNGSLKASVEFMDNEIDTSGFSDMIYRMVKHGFIKATSVGFLPIEFDYADEKDEKRVGGIDFKKQELLEFSIVPVPSNPEALIEARSKGINIKPLQGWFEEALDDWMNYRDMILLPRKSVEGLYKAASGETKKSVFHISNRQQDELRYQNLVNVLKHKASKGESIGTLGEKLMEAAAVSGITLPMDLYDLVREDIKMKDSKVEDETKEEEEEDEDKSNNQTPHSEDDDEPNACKEEDKGEDEENEEDKANNETPHDEDDPKQPNDSPNTEDDHNAHKEEDQLEEKGDMEVEDDEDEEDEEEKDGGEEFVVVLDEEPKEVSSEDLDVVSKVLGDISKPVSQEHEGGVVKSFVGLPRIADRIFNTPLIVHPRKVNTVLHVIGDRLGIDKSLLEDPTDDELEKEVDEKPYSVDDNGVATIPIMGTLCHRLSFFKALSGMKSYSEIESDFLEALADPEVKAIALHIDSPGGEVAGCFDLADTIYESRGIKPIWAVVDEMACSAAYALASSAEKVFAPRTADVGSIGVVWLHADLSVKDHNQGVNYTFIHAGERKVDGNDMEPLSSEAKKRIQKEIDSVYEVFLETVARNRGLEIEDIKAMQALTYMGKDAEVKGLIDGVSSAKNTFFKLANVAKEVVLKEEKNSPIDFRESTSEEIKKLTETIVSLGKEVQDLRSSMKSEYKEISEEIQDEEKDSEITEKVVAEMLPEVLPDIIKEVLGKELKRITGRVD